MQTHHLQINNLQLLIVFCHRTLSKYPFLPLLLYRPFGAHLHALIYHSKFQSWGASWLWTKSTPGQNLWASFLFLGVVQFLTCCPHIVLIFCSYCPVPFAEWLQEEVGSPPGQTRPATARPITTTSPNALCNTKVLIHSWQQRTLLN